MNRQIPRLLAVVLAAAALSAHAAPALNADDRTFLTDAGTGNQKEIDVSRFAASHASSAKVKAFAQTMVRDHTKLGADMGKLNDGSIASPASDTTPDPDLSGKTGSDFDTAYIDKMVGDHDATVAKFQATAEGAQYSAAIRAAARKALPTIRHHDAMAHAIAASLNAKH